VFIEPPIDDGDVNPGNGTKDGAEDRETDHIPKRVPEGGGKRRAGNRANQD